MSLFSSLNRHVFKRTSTFALAIAASAFIFERAFEMTSTAVFESINKGKLWNDVKDKFPPAE